MTLSSPRWSRPRSLELVAGSGKHSDSDSVYDVHGIYLRQGHVVMVGSPYHNGYEAPSVDAGVPWLRIKKVDKMASMSDMTYDAIVKSRIERYDIPSEYLGMHFILNDICSSLGVLTDFRRPSYFI